MVDVEELKKQAQHAVDAHGRTMTMPVKCTDLLGALTELEQLRSHLEKEPRLGLAVVQLTSEVADLQDQLTSLRQAAAAVTKAWADHDPELHRHVMALARVLGEKP